MEESIKTKPLWQKLLITFHFISWHSKTTAVFTCLRGYRGDGAWDQIVMMEATKRKYLLERDVQKGSQ